MSETAFDAAEGNIIIVDLGDGVIIKYGHLKEGNVSPGDEIRQGQAVAAPGSSGMAAGPDLWFAVTVDGEAVDPLTD